MSFNHLIKQIEINQCNKHIHIKFLTPHKVLSSAVLNGGYVCADHLINVKVSGDETEHQIPQATLEKYAIASDWQGKVVGMMTAASMKSLRVVKEKIDSVELAVVVTAGLSNARRIADRAEHRAITFMPVIPGTINIIVLCSYSMTDSAMAEALMMVTEAKVAALQDANIKSPVSNKIATGTGTDSVAVACGQSEETINYCGKHVLLGEVLGRMVYQAVSSSIVNPNDSPSDSPRDSPRDSTTQKQKG